MNAPSIIFGLREFPRPPRSGFFYCKLPPKFSEWSVGTLAVLDLYNVDETYLSNIFLEGIEKLLSRERLSGERACLLRENHASENMKDFAQEILKRVIDGYISKLKSNID